MPKLISILFIYLFVVSSCKDDATNTETFSSEYITIGASPADKQRLSLSNLFDTIRYVPLETGMGDTLLNDFRKVSIADDKIYFLQGKSASDVAIMVFSLTNGDFLHRIDTPGEGPGRVVAARDFYVSPLNGNLELLDQLQKKILIFDKNGQWIEDITIPEMSAQFVKFPDNSYAFYKGNYPSENDYRLFFTTPDLKITQTELPYEPYSHLFIVNSKNNFINSDQEGAYLFHTFLENTIYQVSSEGLSKKYLLDFDNYWISENDIEQLNANLDRQYSRKIVLDRTDHIFNISTFDENEDWFMFTYFFQNEIIWNFFNKKDGRNSSIVGRENDIDSSPLGETNNWPLMLSENNEVVFVLQAPDVLARLESIALDNNSSLVQLVDDTKKPFYKLGKELKNYSNPVLCFAKLKSDF